MTEHYRYRHDWHDASGDHTVTVAIRTVAATAANSPRATDSDCVLVRWDRAGRQAVAFGDTVVTLTTGQTISVDDWANPDEYWADGGFASWHAALVARFGAQAVACLVTDTGDRCVAHPAFVLGDLTATCAAVDAHGASADGCAVIGPTTTPDWQPDVQPNHDQLVHALARVDAWVRGRLCELVRTSDTDPDEACVPCYDDDLDWAMTRARLWARNYARGYDTT